MFKKIKELFEKWFGNSDKKQILELIVNSPQKGRDMPIIGRENINAEIIEFVKRNNYHIAVEKLSPQIAMQLGFKYPDNVRRTIDAYAIWHTLKQHGKDSNNVKYSGQLPIDESDIANYAKIADDSDEKLDSITEQNLPAKVSFKQINGYHIVVEEIRKKQNELGFKTMFKGNGDYHNSEAYKKALEYIESSAQTPYSPGCEPGGYFIADNSKNNHTQKKQTSQVLPTKHKKFSQMNEAEKELFLKERTQFATDWNQIQSEFLNSSKETTNKSNENVINTLKSEQSSKTKIKWRTQQ